VRIHTVVAVLATAVLAAGCGRVVGGTARSAPTAGKATSDFTENGAPRVKTPLNFAKSAAAPCGLLTAAQLQGLGMAGVVGKDDSGPTGPSCGWADSFGPSGQTVFFTFVPGDGGLDFLYESKSRYGLFEPLPPIQGYPAVLISSNDFRGEGDCGLAVGLTDTQHMLTSAYLLGGTKPAARYSDPCGVAKEAAEFALINIKAGA
jgi:hypothetical protein